MAKVTISLTLDDERDKRILRWLKGLPRRGRSEAMREAINAYLGQDNVTLQDIYDAIQELKQFRLMLVQESSSDVQQQEVPEDILDNIAKIGL